MRILSIVSLISRLGEYGGPTRVAMNQAAALQERGHQVTVVATTRGFDVPPVELDGVPVRLFPARQAIPGTGFAGLTSPGLLRWVSKEVEHTDVVHVHAARDLVTLPAAAISRRAKVPYFMQTHGMIDPSDNPLAGPVDALLTRPLLRDAAGVFYLTQVERDDLIAVAPTRPSLHELGNGVPFADEEPATGAEPEVLFLARLAPRKRPMTFVAASRLLHQRHPNVRFALVGPDEGEGTAVAAAAAEASAQGIPVTWEGALAPERTLERISASTIYVLPAINEPYGMTVLEAMSVAKPVIVTDSCGLADAVRESDSGFVVDDSVEALASAIEDLLADPVEARQKGLRGRDFVREKFSMNAIAATLEAHYAQAAASRTAGTQSSP